MRRAIWTSLLLASALAAPETAGAAADAAAAATADEAAKQGSGYDVQTGFNEVKHAVEGAKHDLVNKLQHTEEVMHHMSERQHARHEAAKVRAKELHDSMDKVIAETKAALHHTEEEAKHHEAEAHDLHAGIHHVEEELKTGFEHASAEEKNIEDSLHALRVKSHEREVRRREAAHKLEHEISVSAAHLAAQLEEAKKAAEERGKAGAARAEAAHARVHEIKTELANLALAHHNSAERRRAQHKALRGALEGAEKARSAAHAAAMAKLDEVAKAAAEHRATVVAEQEAVKAKLAAVEASLSRVRGRVRETLKLVKEHGAVAAAADSATHEQLHKMAEARNHDVAHSKAFHSEVHAALAEVRGQLAAIAASQTSSAHDFSAKVKELTHQMAAIKEEARHTYVKMDDLRTTTSDVQLKVNQLVAEHHH